MIKDNFLKGLRTVLPIVLFIVIIGWITGTLFYWVECIELLFPDRMVTAIGLPDVVIKLLTLFSICVIIWIIGIIANQPNMSRKFKNWLYPIIYRIPLLSHLFSISNKIGQDAESFKRVVYVPWQNNKAWTLGFVTNENPPEKFRKPFPEPENMVAVVVSASPLTSHQPTMMNRKDLLETDISVPEAIEFILSLGLSEASEKLMEESHSESEWDFFNFECIVFLFWNNIMYF